MEPLLTPTARKRHPLRLARHLTAHHRGAGSDAALATLLAGIAGCANAGGFVAFGHYTSHMTGYLSQLADSPALRTLGTAVQSLAAITMFILGAATCAIVINWARLFRRRQQYANPIALQGLLFFGFSGLGSLGQTSGLANGVALGLLCFIMGLQNATITKISAARIRTTHVTGMITDIGIELGRGAFGLAAPQTPVRANRGKLGVLLRLVGTYLLGGVIGAFGYATYGFAFSVPLGMLLLLIALPRLK